MRSAPTDYSSLVQLFEELLPYLRHTGYGTSYITGKMQFDELLAKYAHQQELAGKPFVLAEFMGRFNDAGVTRIPLIIAAPRPAASSRSHPTRFRSVPTPRCAPGRCRW